MNYEVATQALSVPNRFQNKHFFEGLQHSTKLSFTEEIFQENSFETSIFWSLKHFDNVSVDLIYGVPDLSIEAWQENLESAIVAGVPHLSCYALTIEPGTALDRFIKKGVVTPVDEALAKAHYELLLDYTEQHGFENYEFSNFGKPNFFSRNTRL